MRVRALGVLLLCTGCASAPLAGPSLRAASVPEGDGWEHNQDQLSITMRAVSKQMLSAELSPRRGAFAGFLTTGARATHRLDLPKSTCVTLLAIASPGVQDMDAALYTAAGELLAMDSQPNPHPAIQVCSALEPTQLYYALQVYEGAGSYLVVAFAGKPSALRSAVKLLDGQPAVARLDQTAAESPDRVMAFGDGLSRRGFKAVQAPLRVALAPGQKLRLALRTDPGVCYTAAGFALQGLENIDLRVLDEQASEVARDASMEQDASAQFCADRQAEYAVELRNASGAGDAVLLLFRAEAASIGGQSGLWLGEHPLADASAVPLSDAIAEVTRRARKDGFAEGHTLLTRNLAPGEAIAQPVTLAAKRCARIHAVGGPGVRRLTLIAQGESGEEAMHAEGNADTSYVHVCATTARRFMLQLLALSGSGPIALTMHETSLASVVPKGANETVAARLTQAQRQAHDAGYLPHPDFSKGPRHVALQSSLPVTTPLHLDPSRCVRTYLLSADPSARAELLIAGKQLGDVATRDKVAQQCATIDQAKLSGPIELRASTTSESGDAWLMVFTR